MDTDERNAVTGVTTRLDENNNFIAIHKHRSSIWRRIPGHVIGTIGAFLVVILLVLCVVFVIIPNSFVVEYPKQNATKEELYTFWSNNTSWIPLSEHYALRQSPDVYNLAFFDKGIVRYSKFSILPDNTHWKPVNETEKPPFTYRVKDATVFITDGNKEYVLNVYEPFVFGHTPETIYVIVPQGAIWRMDTHDVEFVQEKDLKGTVPTNPLLSQ